MKIKQQIYASNLIKERQDNFKRFSKYQAIDGETLDDVLFRITGKHSMLDISKLIRINPLLLYKKTLSKGDIVNIDLHETELKEGARLW